MMTPPLITTALVYSAGMITGMVIGSLIAYRACRKGIRDAILHQQRFALETTFETIANVLSRQHDQREHAPTLH